MNLNQQTKDARAVNPFKSRWFWIAVLFMTPLWGIWFFVHWRSYAIVNGFVPGIGCPVMVLLVGIRQRDWRIIALAVGYAGFVYWLASTIKMI